MAKTDNLKDYLTDLYEGIKSKNPNASRNPQNFRTDIEAIEAGVNTTDATATSSDILLGKTAYVNDEKIEGTIETYDYSVDEGGSSEDYLEALCNNTLTSYSNSNITNVKHNTFYSSVVESVDLPNCLKLGLGAFEFCRNLISINIPLVTTLLDQVFKNCEKIENISLPLVETISYRCFYNCYAIADIYLGANQLVTLSNKNAFDGVTGGLKIHVRPEYADQYTEATNWSSLIASGQIVIVGDYSD